jgi:hypothetical protein
VAGLEDGLQAAQAVLGVIGVDALHPVHVGPVVPPTFHAFPHIPKETDKNQQIKINKKNHK